MPAVVIRNHIGGWCHAGSGNGIKNRDGGGQKNLKSRNHQGHATDKQPKLAGCTGLFTALFLAGDFFPTQGQKEYHQSKEQKQKGQQLARQAQVRERVHRAITQNARAGQEGCVQHQNKTQHHHHQGGLEGITTFGVGMHPVQGPHHQKPGQKRGILNGIPGPIPPEIQGLVGPGGPHNNPAAQG